MSFLNRALDQLREWLEPLPMAWRVATFALLAAAAAGLLWTFSGGRSTADGYLLGGRPFSANEAAAIESAFAKAGLTGAVLEGNRIRIPQGDEPKYLLAMAEENALPKDFHESFGRTIAETTIFRDPKTRDELIKNARQIELANIIRAMPGVETAAVHYDIHKSLGLSRQGHSSASVSVKPVLSKTLDREQVRKIRHLVAAAIGIKPDHVTVADLSPGGGVFVGAEGDQLGEGEDHKYLAVQRAHQTQIESNVLKALSYVPGVMVSASVELHPEIETTRSGTRYDNKAAGTLNRRDENSQRTVQSQSGGGRPGLEAQQPALANQAASLSGRTVNNSEDSNSVLVESSLPAHETQASRIIGLTPKLVKVSVSVPMSYYEAIWRQLNPPQDGQPAPQITEAELLKIEEAETRKIERHVAQLLPTSAAEGAATVQVSSFRPVAGQDLSAPSFLSQALEWLAGAWTTVGLFLLALASLLMVRSFVRSIPPASAAAAPPPAPTPGPAAGEQASSSGENETGAAKEPPKRMLARRVSGGSLKDELAEIVREDPDAAANIIKSWIGSGA